MPIITVSTEVSAALEKVWDCFTNPTHIVNWCFASDDWSAPRAENDLRVGGRFITRMEAKDGGAEFDFSGVYTIVEPTQRFEYVMDDGRKVGVTFEVVGDKTKVTETFDPENENPLEMQRSGWQSILDNFKKYTESV